MPGQVDELVVGYAWRMLARNVRLEAEASGALSLGEAEFELTSASGEVRIPYTLIDPEEGFIDLAITGIVNGREVTQRARVQVRPPKNDLAATASISQR